MDASEYTKQCLDDAHKQFSVKPPAQVPPKPKPQYTPGDWEAINCGNQQFEVQGPNGEIICRVNETTKCYSAFNNAQAIAAVPRLLNACLKIKYAYNPSGSCNVRLLNLAYDAVCDALATIEHR